MIQYTVDMQHACILRFLVGPSLTRITRMGYTEFHKSSSLSSVYYSIIISRADLEWRKGDQRVAWGPWIHRASCDLMVRQLSIQNNKNIISLIDNYHNFKPHKMLE